MAASIWTPGGVLTPQADPNSQVKSQIFTATEGQTLFTLTNFTYVVNNGALTVYRNGVKQVATAVTETSTSSFTLEACEAGEVIEAVGQTAVADATGAAAIATAAAAAASASAAAASASEIAADADATAAAGSASSASSSAANASASASAASASEIAAAASEAAAALSKTNAGASEVNAAASESAAIAAKNAAEIAASTAVATLDEFDDRYLGAKAADPTLDNDGNALAEGQLYWNTASKVMKVYNATGAVWEISYAPVAGYLQAANNLSDLANAATARENLDLEIGVDVLAFAAAASQAEMEAGTEAGLRTMSPLRVAQAIAALAGSGSGDFKADGSVVMTGDLQIGAGKGIILEGATDNAYETTLGAVDPTADRTINLPDKSGTVALTSDIPSASGDAAVMDFRLTLTSGTPVTTTDVTGATTIYCTPYKGKQIGLYDGSAWNIRSSAEFSLALGTLTSGKPYDVFCYDNAGTPTLEFLVWTNDTTRATALAYQDGILVKSGAATRRYLGTFYTTAATTTEDSIANRYLYNYYNRVTKRFSRNDTTDNWTYGTNAWRQANGSAANQVNVLQGVSEDYVEAFVGAMTSHNANYGFGAVGIGVDVTNANSAQVTLFAANSANSTNSYLNSYASYRGVLSAGRHFLAWIEYASGNTAIFVGDAASPGLSGLIGSLKV